MTSPENTHERKRSAVRRLGTTVGLLGAGAVLAACATGSQGGDGENAPTFLPKYLARGDCKVVMLLWSESDRANAKSYIKANGAPTEACPEPDVTIDVSCDITLTTGDRYPGEPGRKIIRYAYFGATPGECEDPIDALAPPLRPSTAA